MRGLWLITLTFMTVILASCGGGGSSSPAPQSVAPTSTSQPSATSVTLSGKITYDRVDHNQNSGLDYANIKAQPARGIVVELIDSSDNIITSALTDGDGLYSFTTDPNVDLRIRAKAQILSEAKAKWDFQVTDNTQGNRLYALQGSLANTGSSARQTRDLHAPLGCLLYTSDAADE